MNIYKNSLNLPKTKFTMRANLIIKEPHILEKWKKEKIYTLLSKKSKKKRKKFIIHDGPPYANGKIHIGHALNKILKDIILKYKNLSGYYTPFIPTWDCHGLPIEHEIEKKIKNKKKTSNYNKNFRKKCRKYAYQQIKNQKKDFIRLGIFANWKNPILTMNYKNQANVMKKLIKIHKKNFLYSKLKPVYWCLNCRSSLADAEIEYLKKKSISIIFRMTIDKPKTIFNLLKIKKKKTLLKKIYFLIWTTTPWTLPTNQAVSLKPNSIYNFIEIKNKIFVLSKKIFKKNPNIFKNKKYKIIGSLFSEQIENFKLKHLFRNTKVKIILSNHVNLNSGTGIVHMSPDHGLEDYKDCQKYNINPLNFVNSQGKYRNNIHPLINGKKISKCNNKIIKFLKNKKKIINKKIITHSYPHCWRHKKPVIYKATKQWFIKIKKKNFNKQTYEQINNIKWIPKWSKKSMLKLFKNRPDWCISRQRIWGIPIPFIIKKKKNQIYKKNNLIFKSIINVIKKKGIQKWYDFNLKKILNKKNIEKYKKSKDILDVWFDSGCIHHSKNYQKKNSNKKEIADLCIEGIDQQRGWFMSSIIISSILNNKKPFKKILMHGFVIDQNKKKMSKSIGNTISPHYIIKKYGADILRLWVASSDYTNDIIISNTIIQQNIEIYRKIRNTIRFILSNINDFNPKKDKIKNKNMLSIDFWALQKTKKIQKKIIKLYKKYNFHKIIKILVHFCSINMSSNYFEIIKNRQYTMKKKSIGRKSCQTTLYKILICLTKWIAPILPFTADEVWTHITHKKKNIFLSNWNKNIIKKKNNLKIKFEHWNKIFKIKNKINKKIEILKKKKIINNSLETTITILSKKKIYKILKIIRKELQFFFIVSKVKIKKIYKNKKKIKNKKYIKKIIIKIKKNSGKKCQRCWNYSKKLKKIYTYTKICKKCFLNIKKHSNGEKRKFI